MNEAPTTPKVTRSYNLQYWSLHAGNAILITLTCLLFFNALAYRFKFTFYEPATSPGHLTEHRYKNPIFWLLWITMILRTMLIVFTTMRAFVPENPTISTVHLVILFIYIVTEVISLIFHIVTLQSGNNSPNDSPSGAGNICNDYRYCCVYHDLPNSECPVLLAPCSPFVNETDLETNFECTISLSFSPILIVLGLFITLITYSMGRGKDIWVEQYQYDQNVPVYTDNKIGNNISGGGSGDGRNNNNNSDSNGKLKFKAKTNKKNHNKNW